MSKRGVMAAPAGNELQMDYLARYREGEHVHVWTELYGQGGSIRGDQVM